MAQDTGRRKKSSFSMKFLKHFRSKSKLKGQQNSLDYSAYPLGSNAAVLSPSWQPTGPDCTKILDRDPRARDKILKRIFEFVCPHAQDETYTSCEESADAELCMLCDLRDLSHCCMVKRIWFPAASGVLYRSIRIDAVHYCELEEIFTEQRRRKSWKGEDIPATRVRLLADVLKKNFLLGHTVQYMKLPYMTREICKADLARCISACPNLVYVDLPEGCFTGSPDCYGLIQELQENCQHIRRMKYDRHSEPYFQTLVQGKWPELETLELSRLNMESGTLRQVLGSLQYLKELSFTDISWLNDEIFTPAHPLPDFPALNKVTFKDTPHVTHTGLLKYVQNRHVSTHLNSLTLEGTGVALTEMNKILWACTALTYLSVRETVSTSLPLEPVEPLASITLHTLCFEITSSEDVRGSLRPPAGSYYNYLVQSLQSSSLPALRKLYVQDPQFPEMLTMAPPALPFADGSAARNSNNPFLTGPRGFSQPLEVFSKGIDEQDWVFHNVMPAEPAEGRRGSMSGGRPLSSYSAHKGLGPQWGGDARKSVIVGNGFGGFLAVPDDEPERPKTSGGPGSGSGGGGGVRSSYMQPPRPSFGGGAEKPRQSWFKGHGANRASRHDLWR